MNATTARQLRSRRVRRAAWMIGLIALLILIAAGPSPAGTIWYSAEPTGNSGFSHLFSIDPSSNDITDRGQMDRRWVTDLAINQDGDLYGVGWRNKNGSGNAKLFTISAGDDHTVAVTDDLQTVGGQLSPGVNGLAFYGELLLAANYYGGMQVLREENNHKWRIINEFNLPAPSAGDIAVRPGGASAYVTLSNGKIAGFTLDAAGRPGNSILYAQTGYPLVYGLAFGSEERLYGFTNNYGNNGPSQMIEINTQTGQGFGAVSLGGQSVWGAASYAEAGSGAPVPEPATLAMLVLGGAAMALGFRRRRRMT